MKIAVASENGKVFQHFGHTPEFIVFEEENGRITAEKRLSCGETGHGALATLLADEQVDLLICGGIGAGAVNALAAMQIEVVRGAEGNVREVAEALLNGTLSVRDEALCSHHGHGHGREAHTCGDHGCGDHGNGCSH